MEILETNLKGKSMLLFLQMDPTSSHDFLFRRFNLRGPPSVQTRDETAKKKNPEEKIPIQSMVTLKISKKRRTRRHRPYDLPTWGQIKTLTNQTEKSDFSTGNASEF